MGLDMCLKREYWFRGNEDKNREMIVDDERVRRGGLS